MNNKYIQILRRYDNEDFHTVFDKRLELPLGDIEKIIEEGRQPTYKATLSQRKRESQRLFSSYDRAMNFILENGRTKTMMTNQQWQDHLQQQRIAACIEAVSLIRKHTL